MVELAKGGGNRRRRKKVVRQELIMAAFKVQRCLGRGGTTGRQTRWGGEPKQVLGRRVMGAD